MRGTFAKVIMVGAKGDWKWRRGSRGRNVTGGNSCWMGHVSHSHDYGNHARGNNGGAGEITYINEGTAEDSMPTVEVVVTEVIPD